jgi:CDP-diacylglycerol--serine O-phosphatidyltransferase
MPTPNELLPQRAWIPCLLTAANIAAGFSSIVLAAHGRFDRAVYVLCLAIVLDMLDGRVARLLRATSEFGRQLDSFSDAISFGAAPALLVHLAILRELGALGIATAVVYVLTGLFRLARFNLLSDFNTKSRRTLGLPIPIGASYLMAVVLMREHLPPIIGAAIVLFMAGGMASRWRLPELKGIGPVTAMLGVGIINYLTFVAWPNWYTFGWWNFWNVLIVLASRVEGRRLALETSAEP